MGWKSTCRLGARHGLANSPENRWNKVLKGEWPQGSGQLAGRKAHSNQNFLRCCLPEGILRVRTAFIVAVTHTNLGCEVEYKRGWESSGWLIE